MCNLVALRSSEVTGFEHALALRHPRLSALALVPRGTVARRLVYKIGDQRHTGSCVAGFYLPTPSARLPFRQEAGNLPRIQKLSPPALHVEASK